MDKEFKQTIVGINFENEVSEERREEIVSKLYVDYEKEIIGMVSIHMKKNVDTLPKVRKVCGEA
jgi:hypothetical protein